jgi:polar amino acid transport system substrate-binding protein
VIAGVVLLALGLAPSALAQKRQLRLVSTPWPPFTAEIGESRLALDLVDEALERLDITVETTIVDESELTPSLLEGDFDGSAALWRDEEREQVLLYSEPYLENRLVLVGRTGSDVSATTLSALAGARVALIEGYAYGDAVNARPGPIYVKAKSGQDSLQKLLSGEADYTLMDELVVEYLVTNYEREARTQLAFGETPLVTRSLHLAINRNLPDAASIIRRFNDELKRMVADRSYHRLLHLDWIRADVDGDGRTELVPRSDQAGPIAPDRGYDLFTTGRPLTDDPDSVRFYIGGNVYTQWTAVPERYRVSDPSKPDPTRSSFGVFRFEW